MTLPAGRVDPRRIGSGRLVAEAVVVGLAIVGAVLLHGRNAASVSSQVGADPFLAVAPALVGLAAGIIAVRLLPVVLRLLARMRGPRDAAWSPCSDCGGRRATAGSRRSSSWP